MARPPVIMPICPAARGRIRACGRACARAIAEAGGTIRSFMGIMARDGLMKSAGEIVRPAKTQAPRAGALAAPVGEA